MVSFGLSLIAGLFGLIIGSFLNVVILRYGHKRGPLTGRSECPNCHAQLAMFDLVPVLSFIWLGGRCRNCHKHISWQYPLVELVCAIGTGLLFAQFGLSLATLATLLFFWTSLVIVGIDLREGIIPDQAVGLIVLAWALWFIGQPSMWNNLGPVLLGALIGGGFFLLIILLTRGRAMGLGDAKLGFSLGLWLSFPSVIVGLLLAIFLGALVGIGLLLFRNAKLKDAIPFGPFLLLGALLGMLWGDTLVRWFLTF